MAQKNWKLQEFVAHGSCVNCLALNQSGRTLATGGDDRKVNLWAVGSPNLLISFTGHTSPVESVVFNEPEECLAAGSKSGSIRVFDLAQHKAIRALSGHKAGVTSLDFHRYGDILVSGSMDTTVKLWDIRRKGCIITYSDHTDVVNSLQFSPDGRWVVSASGDSTVKLWDLVAGKMMADFSLHTAAVSAVRFHPKEFVLATGSADRTVRFWDLEQLQPISCTVLEATGVRCITFHPEGGTLFSATQDALRLYTWDPDTVCTDSLPVQWGKPGSVVVFRDQLIAASSAQTSVSVWVVDIKKLRPFNGEVVQPVRSEGGRVQQAGPPKAATLRRRFEEKVVHGERPHTSSTRPSQPKSQSERRSSEEDRAEGSPEVSPKERENIFIPRSTLARSPPHKFYEPFVPPPEAAGKKQSTPLEAGPALLQAQPPPAAAALEESRELPYNDFIPANRPTPVGVDVEPSLKRALSDEQALAKVTKGHAMQQSIMVARVGFVKKVKEVWNSDEPRVAVEEAVLVDNSLAVLVDLLNVLKQKKGLWSLDLCTVVLPEANGLVFSKHDAHVTSGCAVVSLILKLFGPLISESLSAQPTTGVDLSREERLRKCEVCYTHLRAIESSLCCPPSNASEVARKRYKNLQSLFAAHLRPRD